MRHGAQDFDLLIREHHALMRDYGQAQTRCSEQLRLQAREIDRLKAQVIRLRAAIMIGETAWLWAGNDRIASPRGSSVLRAGVELGRSIAALLRRILRLPSRWSTEGPAAPFESVTAPANAASKRDDSDGLEASLGAADLVICQTGCLSHGAYWRVQDHCKRTGRTCVLINKLEALRIVRILGPTEGEGAARVAVLQAEPLE